MNQEVINPEDIQVAEAFCKAHPHLFPAGQNSLKAQIRNRKTNGLTSSGAVVKRFNRMFIVVPKYLTWFAGQS